MSRRARDGGTWRDAFVLPLIAIVAAGCGSLRPYLHPCPTGGTFECHSDDLRLRAQEAGSIEMSLFLVGDAGDPHEMGRRSLVLGHLRAGLEEDVPDRRIVFLGDNIYPDGLRPSSDEGCPSRFLPPDARYCSEDQLQLESQVRIIPTFGVTAYMVPGNHDWANTRGPKGYAILRNQQDYLEGRPATMTPEAGCPGPVTEVVTSGSTTIAHLIFIDTHWLLLPRGSRPQTFSPDHDPPPPDCAIETEEEMYRELERRLDEAGEVPVVVMGHHPVRTHSKHAGVGSATYRFGVAAQDINSVPYRRLIERMEGLFEDRGPETLLISATGHDHILQVLREGDQPVHYLVSGAGSKEVNGVRIESDTVFAARLPGFMRLNFHQDGSVFLYVFAGCHEEMVGETETEPTCARGQFAVVHAEQLR